MIYLQKTDTQSLSYRPKKYTLLISTVAPQ